MTEALELFTCPACAAWSQGAPPHGWNTPCPLRATLIERLATPDGHFDSVFMFCWYCGHDDAGWRKPYLRHEPDCPWVEARKMLDAE